MKKIFYLFLLCSIVIVTSCKKDNKVTPNSNTPSKVGSTLDLIKDSVFLYAKQIYYWNESLPDYGTFKPRSFSGSSDVDALQTEIDALTQYSSNPQNSGKPYEFYSSAPGQAKYSFIDDGAVSGELNGVKGDFGFAPLWIATSDIRVKYVYPGSPADLKGIKRGYQIVAINGRTGTGLDYDGNNTGSTPNVDFLINAYSNSKSITLTLKKPDNTTFDVSMNAGSYTVNPVLTSKVIDAGGGKKVGYIVFNSFTSQENAKPRLDEAFANFTSQNIKDLVVDLRYNGGGYVSTAQYLSNLIAPANADKQPMFSFYYNKTMSTGMATILKNQVRKDPDTGDIYNYFDNSDYTVAGNTVKFSKTGLSSLSLDHVFFIVSGSTASASELTINNLIPKVDVKLIGTATYGKPVGFFDIDINKYQMYIPEFETKNSAGNGGYYAGMLPGSATYPGKNDRDDVTKEFGDPTETLLAYALNYAKNSTFALAGPRIQSIDNRTIFSVETSREAGIKSEGKQFRGMIYRNKVKK
jgi:carboxyl-terminal processing protease